MENVRYGHQEKTVSRHLRVKMLTWSVYSSNIHISSYHGVPLRVFHVNLFSRYLKTFRYLKRQAARHFHMGASSTGWARVNTGTTCLGKESIYILAYFPSTLYYSHQLSEAQTKFGDEVTTALSVSIGNLSVTGKHFTDRHCSFIQGGPLGKQSIFFDWLISIQDGVSFN